MHRCSVLTVVVTYCTYETVSDAVTSHIVGGLLWLGRWWCWWGAGGRGRVTFVLVLVTVPFFLDVEASVRSPNVPLIADLWSAASFRSVKGRAVVVDPVSG